MKRQKFLWSFAAALTVLGTVLRGVSGVRFSAALAWYAALGVLVLAVLDLLAQKRRWARLCRGVLLGLFALGFAFFLVMEALVVAGARTDPEAGTDKVSCVVVLGAGVRGTTPSVTLCSRLDAALAFVADKPEVPILVSGGQGGGEAISEAECMARYLTARGIDAGRIWKEDRSTNTAENFAFSAAVMAEHGLDPTDGFAFVTSRYHLARARRCAGVPRAYGVAAHMPEGLYYSGLELNYFLREAFALAQLLVFGGNG